MSNLRPLSSTDFPSLAIRKRDSMSGTRLMHTAIFNSPSERVEPGHRLSENQCVDVVRALVGVHALEVFHVSHRRILGENPVRAEQPSRLTSDFGRDVHIVALRERNLLRRKLAAILQAA